MKLPLVSVIMSVYNAQNYLREAIESILNQTFSDFECIIINDGSTDNGLLIIQEYAIKDTRIILITRENKGLIFSLNEGIARARGKYIARMDADDISTQDRLEKQVVFLDNHLKVGVLSCRFDYFHKDGTSYAWPFYFQNSEDILSLMPFHSPIVHAAAMIRKELLTELSYDSKFAHAEDYRLWTVLSSKTEFHNLNEVLYKVRLHDTKVSVIYNSIQVENSLSIIHEYLLSVGVTVWDRELHYQMITSFFQDNTINLVHFFNYLDSIQSSRTDTSTKCVNNWLKSIFIINNTKIPFLFIFYLIFHECSVLKIMSVKQIASLLKRSFRI